MLARPDGYWAESSNIYFLAHPRCATAIANSRWASDHHAPSGADMVTSIRQLLSVIWV